MYKRRASTPFTGRLPFFERSPSLRARLILPLRYLTASAPSASSEGKWSSKITRTPWRKIACYQVTVRLNGPAFRCGDAHYRAAVVSYLQAQDGLGSDIS